MLGYVRMSMISKLRRLLLSSGSGGGDGAKVTLAMLSKITRKNGHKLQTKQFKDSLMRLMQHWSRLLIEVVESPSLVTFRT